MSKQATQNISTAADARIVTVTPELQSRGQSLAQAAADEATAFEHLAGMLYIIDIAMTDSMSASSQEFNDHLGNAIRACQKLVEGERAKGTGHVVHDFISSLLEKTGEDAPLRKVA